MSLWPPTPDELALGFNPEPPAPPTTIQVVRVQVVRCASCRSDDVRHNGRPPGGSIAYYRCSACGERFRVQIVLEDPLADTA